MADLPPEQLVNVDVPPPLSKSEKETFEAKIREQREEIDRLNAEIVELKKPAPVKKSALHRFSPLG